MADISTTAKLSITTIGVIGMVGGFLVATVCMYLLSRQRGGLPPQPPKRETTWSEDSARLTYGDSDVERELRAQGKQAHQYKLRRVR